MCGDSSPHPLLIALDSSVAFSAVELADLLASRITIFKLAKAGPIASFRIGACVRFDPKLIAQRLRKM
jgi:hypothetical protein